MDFHQNGTMYSYAKSQVPKVLLRRGVTNWGEFYRALNDGKLSDIIVGGWDLNDRNAANCLLSEAQWYRCEQPYYKFWPGIIKALLKIPLNIYTRQFKLPIDCLAIRFAKGANSIPTPHGEVRTILVSRAKLCTTDGI